jgi:hypothetical protein
MAWVAAWVWNLPIGLLLYLLLLFPDGRLPSRRWLPVAWLSAAWTAVEAVSGGDHAGWYCEGLGPIENPLGVVSFLTEDPLGDMIGLAPTRSGVVEPCVGRRA